MLGQQFVSSNKVSIFIVLELCLNSQPCLSSLHALRGRSQKKSNIWGRERGAVKKPIFCKRHL